MDYEKYYYKYVFMKDGRYVFVKEIIDGIPYDFDVKSKTLIPVCFEEEEIDHIADEICKVIDLE